MANTWVVELRPLTSLTPAIETLKTNYKSWRRKRPEDPFTGIEVNPAPSAPGWICQGLSDEVDNGINQFFASLTANRNPVKRRN
jgi:hypothetical protein